MVYEEYFKLIYRENSNFLEFLTLFPKNFDISLKISNFIKFKIINRENQKKLFQKYVFLKP